MEFEGVLLVIDRGEGPTRSSREFVFMNRPALSLSRVRELGAGGHGVRIWFESRIGPLKPGTDERRAAAEVQPNSFVTRF